MTQEPISRRKYMTYVGGAVVAAVAAAAGYGIGATTVGQAPAQTVTQTVTQTLTEAITATLPSATPTKIVYLGGQAPENFWTQYISNAMVEATKDFNARGIPVQHEVITPIAVANLPRVLEEEIAKGFTYTIYGSEFLSLIPDFAKKYPNIHFSGSFFAPPEGGYALPNTSGFESNTNEANYLSGILGASMTKVNRIGFVNAWDIPSMNTTLNDFILGAKKANPNVKVHYVIPSEWSDPQKGAASVDALAAYDIDFVTTRGDTMSQGVVARAEKLGILSVGDMTDAAYQAKYGPTTCLASSMFKAKEVFMHMYDQAIEIKETGKQYPVWHSYGIKDNGQDLDLNKDLIHLIPSSVLSLIDKERADIVSGATKVPWLPTLPPNPA